MSEIHEKNRQERIAAGLHPKMGYQGLAEQRRVLMTWTKAEIVDFYLREESDAIKASDRAIAAEQTLRDHRAEAFTISKRPIRDTPKTPEQKAAWEEWQYRFKGQSFLADSIFNAGWNARAALPADSETESETRQ